MVLENIVTHLLHPETTTKKALDILRMDLVALLGRNE